MPKLEDQILAFRAPLIDVCLVEPGAIAHEQLLARHQAEVTRAYERGRTEGEKALGEQLIQQRNTLHQLENGILTSLRRVVPEIRESCQQSLVELSLEIARRLVADIPISVEMVEGAIRESLEQVEDSTEVTVHLHPGDYELLRSMESPCLQETAEMKIVPSPEVSRGGCMVHTRFGVIDSRRETKIKLLENAILG